MDYSDLDPPLAGWARRHGLFVSTRHRDDDVRAVLIVDDAGDEYQLWLTPPNAARQLEVHLARKTGPSVAFHTSVDHLHVALDDAYRTIEAWMAAAGHTRTVYGVRSDEKS
jgi:hypothetical protein